MLFTKHDQTSSLSHCILERGSTNVFHPVDEMERPTRDVKQINKCNEKELAHRSNHVVDWCTPMPGEHYDASKDKSGHI